MSFSAFTESLEGSSTNVLYSKNTGFPLWDVAVVQLDFKRAPRVSEEEERLLGHAAEEALRLRQ